MIAPDHIYPADAPLPARAPCKLLTIEHNHGILVLKDVTWEPYRNERGIVCYEAAGTVVDGGVTNRLFSSTSYRPFPKGELMTYPIYGRTPYLCQGTDDEWRVSVQSCG